MTISVSITVNDGIVLAADSASTISDPKGGVINIYENANKISNLIKSFPIGIISWGSGSIGNASIATLIKDFRKNYTKKNTYTLKDISGEFREFIFNKKYQETFKDSSYKPNLGFVISGYSSNRDYSEEWIIEIKKGQCEDIKQLRPPNTCGIYWNGEVEAIHRLVKGYSVFLKRVLNEVGINENIIKQVIDKCDEILTRPLAIPPMPIQDAIDLGIFLVETTIKYSRFIPGAPTVGGPIEVVAITKHEGFKWIKRKHYFNIEFNKDWQND